MGGWNRDRCGKTGEGISHEGHEGTRKGKLANCVRFLTDGLLPFVRGDLRGVFLTFAIIEEEREK